MSKEEPFLWQPPTEELARYLDLADHFYVFHGKRFEDNCERFVSAFKRRYANTRLAYSVKTNYLPSALKQIDKLGWYSEVVSGFEYDLVKHLGITGENIIFNGPIKTQDELFTAIKDGAIINVDSLEELDRIASIAHAQRKTAKLGIRLNFSEVIESTSRFGLIADRLAAESIQRIFDDEYLEFNGLHTHYCFSGKKPQQYSELVNAMIDFIDSVSPDLWRSLGTLNFGGGFFSPMPGKMANNWQGEIPSYDDYAEAIVAPLAERLQKDNLTAPQLILEPGLAVIADAMSFVCRVDSIKTGAKQACAILNGSVYNIKPTKSPINLAWTQYNFGSEQIALKGSLTGYTCMEDDVLDSDFDGLIAEKDVFVFGNVGAYTVVLQPSFIRLAPAVFACENDSIVTLVAAQSNDGFIKHRFNDPQR